MPDKVAESEYEWMKKSYEALSLVLPIREGDPQEGAQSEHTPPKEVHLAGENQVQLDPVTPVDFTSSEYVPVIDPLSLPHEEMMQQAQEKLHDNQEKINKLSEEISTHQKKVEELKPLFGRNPTLDKKIEHHEMLATRFSHQVLYGQTSIVRNGSLWVPGSWGY